MKLYVWRGDNTAPIRDYFPGLVVALANSPEEALRVAVCGDSSWTTKLREEEIKQFLDRCTCEVFEIDKPIGFYEGGGG